MTEEQKQLLIKLNGELIKLMPLLDTVTDIIILVDQINTSFGIQSDVSNAFDVPEC